MHRVREDAIVDAVNRLLADKGFDLMTVDAVAAEVGIAKASLYKHFESKEALAAAAMIRILKRAHAYLIELKSSTIESPVERLQAVVRWTIGVQLAGEMPSLPAQNSVLRTALLNNAAYMGELVKVTDTLGAWIIAAQAAGQVDEELPPEVVLYTLFARACDPVLGILKASGQYTADQMTHWLIRSCFHGLCGSAAVPGPAAAASNEP